jgi:hypothetical protein
MASQEPPFQTKSTTPQLQLQLRNEWEATLLEDEEVGVDLLSECSTSVVAQNLDLAVVSLPQRHEMGSNTLQGWYSLSVANDVSDYAHLDMDKRAMTWGLLRSCNVTPDFFWIGLSSRLLLLVTLSSSLSCFFVVRGGTSVSTLEQMRARTKLWLYLHSARQNRRYRRHRR